MKMIKSNKVNLIYKEIIDYIIDLVETDQEFAFQGIKYIFEVQEEFDINSIVKLLEKQGLEESDIIMTMADKLRQEGRQEGMREELIDTVAVLLNKKLNLKDTKLDGRIKSLDIEKLRKIFEISSLDDLERYVN